MSELTRWSAWCRKDRRRHEPWLVIGLNLILNNCSLCSSMPSPNHANSLIESIPWSLEIDRIYNGVVSLVMRNQETYSLNKCVIIIFIFHVSKNQSTLFFKASSIWSWWRVSTRSILKMGTQISTGTLIWRNEGKETKTIYPALTKKGSKRKYNKDKDRIS